MASSLYLDGRRRLGVLGGGQLGRMLCQAASPLDIEIHILDPEPLCPAHHGAARHQVGSFKDYDAVLEFGRSVDLLTVEIEDVNTEALVQLEKEGIPVFPQPSVLKVIQDKGLQKEHYAKHDLPTMPFKLYQNADEVRAAYAAGDWKLPFVQKSRRAGYDGQGVRVVREEADLEQLIDAPCLIEEACDIHIEIAVIVARNQKKQVENFEPIGMVFDPVANLIDHLCYPAHIQGYLEEQACELARKTIETFGMYGLLAVEMFLDKEGRLFINEVAPRPHNSGHQTIESCETSQYEQHLRSVFNLPLGSTKLKKPSVMLNLLGAEGFSGPVYYNGLEEALATEGVKVHLYGKAETRPWRKMGHVTVLGDSLASALVKAQAVKSSLKVESRVK